MNDQPTGYEAVEEASRWGVGLGIVTFALFPLAIPILLLTAVAVLPLLVPVLAGGVVAGVVYVPIVVLRRLRGRRPARTAGPESKAPRARGLRPEARHLTR